MDYPVDCECGNNLLVTESSAGAKKKCDHERLFGLIELESLPYIDFKKDPESGRVLFYLSISTHKRLDSLGYVEIEKKRLYVQAKFREKNNAC